MNDGMEARICKSCRHLHVFDPSMHDEPAGCVQCGGELRDAPEVEVNVGRPD